MGWTATSHVLALSAAVAAGFIASSTSADAGGFSVREQSTSGLGAAFAGIAAGHDLSSVFWNPAAVSAATGLEVEGDASLLVPNAEIDGSASLEPAPPLQPLLGSSVPLLSLDSSSGNLIDPAFVPAIYAGMPLRGGLSIGFGFNGPFGVATEPDHDNWAGKFEARSSNLLTYNFNPVASYRLSPDLVLGAGIQFQFADAALKSAFPGLGGLAGPNPNFVVKGDGFGVGYTLGLLWRPADGTEIGFGFRSSVEHTLEGDAFVGGSAALGDAKIGTDLQTPAIATASLRQRAGQRLTLLGTVEWTDWSELEQLVVRARTSNPNLGATAGGILTTLPLNWHDGWFFSGGAEYALSDRTTLRTGAAWEQSPVQNASERSPRVPDTDRIWVSLGAGYRLSERTSVDLAYAHVFFEDGAIDRTTPIPGLGQVRLLAEATQDLDIVSVSLKVKLGRPGR
jgi:long-chain fatty acid transport protein